ncbi:MAG: hypothetical protein ACKOHG_00165, partial [Planctomycetia bacterium]
MTSAHSLAHASNRCASLPCGSRRAFLRHSANGFGFLAFSAMSEMSEMSAMSAEAAEREEAVAGPLAPKPPHFPARAKRV